MDRVCTRCIGDDDLKQWMRKQGGPRGCDYCNTSYAPTVELQDLCDYIESCICQYWGRAVEQLPYESREGGYQGRTWDTYEVIFDEMELDLPLDTKDSLRYAIAEGVGDELWCDYDWLSLDQDVAMISGWSRFCNVVKHKRRFFFQEQDYDPEDRDSYSPLAILHAIAVYSERHHLIKTIRPSTRLYRARDDLKHPRYPANEFGPPPYNVCQSNRMNPAGVPMFYASFDRSTAVKEVKQERAALGRFTTTHPLRVLDLTQLPPEPGYFADTERDSAMQLSFLNHFAAKIMQPVARDNLVHVEYVPSQIVTEFLRDYLFNGGNLDGVLYGSVASPGRKNVVLFVDTLNAIAPPPTIGIHLSSSMAPSCTH
ncbi:HEPN-associated N-terminal domain-containing protein [Pseudomonas aeruginosa]|uniref:HEPN-associated N-terminal domain-containing protein n=1 Tax=Pseudomonas aeruginosa TaxID=287 RepID=UPI002381CE85|nr:HEPN-associated N-terminal domain-containing protein [Pseudomonas aeruginosa]